MGRYDRETKRYSRFKTKQGDGIPVLVVLLLMLAAALAGFFARPYVDGIVGSTEHLLMLAAETGKPEAEAADANLPSPSPQQSTTEALEQVVPPPAPIILPTLDSSDNEVRKAVINAAPELAPWLVADGLIRKFMAIANDFAQGQRLNKHLDFMKLPQAFTVEESGGGLFIAPESHQRYNAMALAIDHLDAEAMAGAYRLFKPLLRQVYDEFGYPDDYALEMMLVKAGTEVLSAPIIEGAIPVLKHSVHYQFADPQLEAMGPVHKQMLRMGSENTRMIQNKVRMLLEKIVVVGNAATGKP